MKLIQKNWAGWLVTWQLEKQPVSPQFYNGESQLHLHLLFEGVYVVSPRAQLEQPIKKKKNTYSILPNFVNIQQHLANQLPGNLSL
jgi:hypothetical protein